MRLNWKPEGPADRSWHRGVPEDLGSWPRTLAVFWAGGVLALALTTIACIELSFDQSAAGFIYLIVIVLLSLVESLVSSIIFSLIAAVCLNFFFVPPLFTLQIDSPSDLVAVVAFLFTTLAITALLRHSRRLAQARREQATLIDLTHDTVVVRDASDRIVFWNRAAEQMYGWPSALAIGQNVNMLLKTQFPVPFATIADAIAHNDRWEGEVLHTTREGKTLAVASRWSVLRDERRQVLSTLETNNDITERKQAEAALKQSQAVFLAEAQKLSRTGSFGWNATTRELTWSEQIFGIFGYPEATAPTMERMLERVHPDDLAQVTQLIDNAVAARRDLDLEARLCMPDESTRHVRVVARVVADDTTSLRYIGAVMDVSTAKRSEEQLHDMQSKLAYVTRAASLGELSASMAHEVRQPLAAIVADGEACLRWLRHEVPQLDEALGCAGRMVSNAARAGEIVHRIRSLTRRAVPRKVPLAVNDVIADVAAFAQRDLASHRVTLKLDLARALPSLSFDRVELQQVVINLVTNAIDAMSHIDDRARELEITSRLDDDGKIVIAVRDNGTGIASDHTNRIFEAFFSTRADSMGMGLSICRSIVEAHGGRIWAVNNPRYGATVQCCFLPVADSYQRDGRSSA
ncbi:two-component system, LuxR family, sensor kinase FixL [Pararobbsia alpina]